MKVTHTDPSVLALSGVVLSCLLGTAHGAYCSVGSFDGAVTAAEISSFNEVVTSSTPATSNIGNAWAQGDSGNMMQAINLIYLIGGQQTTLDQMIRYCDAVLSERNDLAKAPIGQYKIWTEDIAPVWPNDVTESPIGTGGEQGDTIGHLATCANNILKNKTIYDDKPSIGDPHGYGATYLDRAKKYVQEADYSMTDHVLSRLLDLSNDKKMYFAKDSAYQPGGPVPWNQQMMFNYGFENLATAHELLGDDPARVTRYHQIVQDSFNWFFTEGVQTLTDPAGNQSYLWGYALPNIQNEDQNHGALDVAGFTRAYMTGNFGITADEMTKFANRIVDVVTVSPTLYTGYLNGTTGSGNSGSTDYLRAAYIFLTEFRPDAYTSMLAGARMTENSTTTNYANFSRFLWVKYRRSLSGVAESKAVAANLLSGYDPRTGTVDSLMTVSNDSLQNLKGPFYLTLTGAPAGVTIVPRQEAGRSNRAVPGTGAMRKTSDTVRLSSRAIWLLVMPVGCRASNSRISSPLSRAGVA
jgi:hypothetical protein